MQNLDYMISPPPKMETSQDKIILSYILFGFLVSLTFGKSLYFQTKNVNMMKLFTEKEAAEILKLSLSGMKKLVREGKIKSSKPAGRRYFTEKDIEAFIQSGRA